MNTNPHYTFNSIDFKPPELNPKKVETVQMDISFDDSPHLVDDYIKNINNNGMQHSFPERESYPHSHNNSITDPNFFTDSFNIANRTPEKKIAIQHCRTSNSGSLIKYFKNIFKSGK